jgi:hypothetical protein
MNQGTKWLLLMKKNRSQKSRASVPLRYILSLNLPNYFVIGEDDNADFFSGSTESILLL